MLLSEEVVPLILVIMYEVRAKIILACKITEQCEGLFEKLLLIPDEMDMLQRTSHCYQGHTVCMLAEYMYILLYAGVYYFILVTAKLNYTTHFIYVINLLFLANIYRYSS